MDNRLCQNRAALLPAYVTLAVHHQFIASEKPIFTSSRSIHKIQGRVYGFALIITLRFCLRVRWTRASLAENALRRLAEYRLPLKEPLNVKNLHCRLAAIPDPVLPGFGTHVVSAGSVPST